MYTPISRVGVVHGALRYAAGDGKLPLPERILMIPGQQPRPLRNAPIIFWVKLRPE